MTNNYPNTHGGAHLEDERFCVVDVETTGLGEHDRVIEVAAVRFQGGVPVDALHTLVNPQMPINPEASAAHFLTARDLRDAPFMDEVEAPLDDFVAGDIVVAHNAPFDRRHLPVLHDRKWICSYRFARHLWTDAPSYRNQVLRYWLGLDAAFLENVTAHRALGDCLVTGLLFKRELRAYDIRFNESGLNSLLDVAAFVAEPVRVERFLYGRKYRGNLVADIPTEYLEWVIADATAAENERRLRVDDDTLSAVKFALLARRAKVA